MPDNDAEEITIVLKDGTVERWTGETATRIAGYIHGLMAIAGGVKLAYPTTTKPLRHVEEVVGWVDSDFRGTICLERTGPGEVNAVQIDCVVPDECIAKGDEEPKTYRFRFVVEAEAVEEKGR